MMDYLVIGANDANLGVTPSLRPPNLTRKGGLKNLNSHRLCEGYEDPSQPCPKGRA